MPFFLLRVEYSAVPRASIDACCSMVFFQLSGFRCVSSLCLLLYSVYTCYARVIFFMYEFRCVFSARLLSVESNAVFCDPVNACYSCFLSMGPGRYVFCV